MLEGAYYSFPRSKQARIQELDNCHRTGRGNWGRRKGPPCATDVVVRAQGQRRCPWRVCAARSRTPTQTRSPGLTQWAPGTNVGPWGRRGRDGAGCHLPTPARGQALSCAGRSREADSLPTSLPAGTALTCKQILPSPPFSTGSSLRAGTPSAAQS